MPKNCDMLLPGGGDLYMNRDRLRPKVKVWKLAVLIVLKNNLSTQLYTNED